MLCQKACDDLALNSAITAGTRPAKIKRIRATFEEMAAILVVKLHDKHENFSSSPGTETDEAKPHFLV